MNIGSSRVFAVILLGGAGALALALAVVGCDSATQSCTAAFVLAAGGEGKFCSEIGPNNKYAELDMADTCARNAANVPSVDPCAADGRIGTCNDLSGEQGPNGEVIAYTAYFYGDNGATAADAKAFCESFHGTFVPS